MKPIKKSNPKKVSMPSVLAKDLAQNIIPQNLQHPYTPRIKHSVNPGDLYAAMGALKKYHDITGRKIIIAQSISTAASYYPGASHPTVNSAGVNVTCNESMFNMMKPLIEAQPYIAGFEVYEGQKCDLDFDVIRGRLNVNLPHGAIQGWIPFAYPDLAFDMSKPWMFVDGKCPAHIKKQVKGKVILNFTERYRNTMLDYFFLQKYTPDLIFAGTEREYAIFCNQWGLTIPKLDSKNFLESAHALKESRFLQCNQSQLFNLAEAIKSPRALEVCQYAQNCISMIGENSYGYLHQAGVEYYFRKLYNETIGK